MRILNWNIEWMNNWFVGGNEVAFRERHERTGITDVDTLCRRVASVIDALDPDVLTIQEGPSDKAEMLLFSDQYLVGTDNTSRFDVFGGIDGRAQKIYILVKKDGALLDAVLANDTLTQGLAESFETDIDGTLQLIDYKFTRGPVVVAGKRSTNEDVRIISLHSKSKYVHQGEDLWTNPNRRGEFIAEAVKNRRRISAEGFRLRGYLDQVAQESPETEVIVTGDFNDGPGVDYFEQRYLTHNVTDILLGSTFRPSLLFKHAFLGSIPEEKAYTAVFDDFIDDIQNRPLLLDHILVSPNLSDRVSGNIAHEEFEAAIDQNARGRQRLPSDHRSVYADV
ncbi:MAG: endonuclease/exonuclease/phosphatase family protein [Cyanobacteria bacterium P01_A01_bin.17]